jgi:hypothetical protein
VLAEPPGRGPGHWAGAPSTALDADGATVVAYRVRSAAERGAEVVVGRLGADGALEPLARLDKGRFGAASLERPALVRTPEGRWRLYVSCATPGSKHWRIDVLEADAPASLPAARARTALRGDARTGVKDPVVRRGKGGWRAWICCHPLEAPGDEDRMATAYATSADGLSWTLHRLALGGRPGRWDARGARVTAVLADGRAAYDGRATAEEDLFERTGLAVPGDLPGTLAAAEGPVRDVRYLDVLELPGGGHRLCYEAPRPDGSHELRTELVPAA